MVDDEFGIGVELGVIRRIWHGVLLTDVETI
jgi:hypothetical protein